MRISSLIAVLQQVLEQNGDLEVGLADDGLVWEFDYQVATGSQEWKRPEPPPVKVFVLYQTDHRYTVVR